MKYPKINRVIEAIKNAEMIGFCLNCGFEMDNVEPDACNYECPACGKTEVFGTEELLIDGDFEQ